jgi:type II secretory pathway pseudopilin PulG
VGATLVVVLPPGGDLEQGFGYVFLLVLIAVLGGVSAYALEEGQLMSRRQAEQELLSVGRSFEEAQYSYSGVRPSEPNSGPLPGVLTATGPAQLEDLLKDPRVPGVRRHLRKIYPDPLTGKTEWGLVRNQAGHIVGIHSLSTGTPIKKSGFDARYAHFGEAERYQDWRFGLPVAEVLIPKQ